ncbi:MAG: hypothetical protein IPG01_13180 [Chitinophagaceae bacterium]|nr:hypothetical protein [Chitinophagaceae bacterium]
MDYLTLYNGEIYFNSGGSGDKELWKSDGTAAGTQLVADINPAGSSKPSYITAANGKLFFLPPTDPEGERPWVSDGTSGGTYLLKTSLVATIKAHTPLISLLPEVMFTSVQRIKTTELSSGEQTGRLPEHS